MKVSLFDFELPPKLIATRPAETREEARLLVVGEELADKTIADLPEFLRAGDMLVLNDTRVIPARLFGMRGEVKVEVLLLKALEGGVWEVFARPAKRLKLGDTITFAKGFAATVEQKRASGEVYLRFAQSGAAFDALLARHGQMPLPPYIARKREADRQDQADYQTIYAREGHSVAAPTAGLHFTETMLSALQGQGVKLAYVNLEVGAGTFQPVKVEDTGEHSMHAERFTISPQTALAINAARENGGRVIAVGTTSLRALESAADEAGVVHAYSGETRIFITPGYQFKTADMLLTNFHLPRSTLFMLVSAFSGLKRMQAAYAHAIAQHYRFYSYGDACLLRRA